MRRRVGLLLGLCLGITLWSVGAAARSDQELVYFGTQGTGGVQAAWLDQKSGELRGIGKVSDIPHPFWLTLHPKLPVLYAAGGTSNTADSTIYSFKVDPKSGQLAELNHQDAGGHWTQHVIVDPSAHSLLEANYNSSTVGVFALQADGSIGTLDQLQTQTGSGPYPRRQEHSQPHYIVFDPRDHFALISDLGADRIFVYRFDPSAHTLQPASEVALPPGSGPRHTVLDARGKYFYVITELTATVHVFSWDAKRAKLEALQSLSAYPDDYSGSVPKSGAEIRLSPNGRFVYVSLRGDQNSIVQFAVNSRDGTLAFVDRVPTGGERPMSFTIDPTGRWMLVANAQSDSVTVLKIDPSTGKLTANGSLAVQRPVAVAFYTH